MKWIISLILVFSLCLNIYFVYNEFHVARNTEFSTTLNRALGNDINKTSWPDGAKSFFDKLKSKNIDISEKRFFYVSIWNPICRPCLREMPWLDSLAGSLRKDVTCFFISDVDDELANNCIERQNYALKNFIFLNGMNDFISGICNEKSVKIKIYPITVVFDQNGKLYHYSVGAYSDKNDAQEFVELINKLP